MYCAMWNCESYTKKWKQHGGHWTTISSMKSGVDSSFSRSFQDGLRSQIHNLPFCCHSHAGLWDWWEVSIPDRKRILVATNDSTCRSSSNIHLGRFLLLLHQEVRPRCFIFSHPSCYHIFTSCRWQISAHIFWFAVSWTANL